MRSVRWVLGTAALVALQSLPAQSLEVTPVMSASAVADSLKVLKRLADVTREHPNDTLAWYRRGMVAFVLAMHARESDHKNGLDERVLRLEAGDALNKAFELDQKNPDYYF